MSEVTQQDVEQCCRIVSEFLPPGHGFIFFTFPTGSAPCRRIRYASNCKRKEAVAALKEWLIQRGFDEDWMRHHD